MANPNSITMTAAAIAAQLSETVSGPRATIWRTVRTLGPEQVQAFVKEALEVEANGGMLIPDGTRTRTLGGIFFYLVRTQVSDDEAMQINRSWRWQQWKQHQPANAKAPTAPAPPPLPPFVWDEADPIIAELIANVGAASTVTFTVLGRPFCLSRFCRLRLSWSRRARNLPSAASPATSYPAAHDATPWQEALHDQTAAAVDRAAATPSDLGRLAPLGSRLPTFDALGE